MVTPAAGGAPVFDEVLTTPYTAKVGDSFLAVERMRLANEGAIRSSIAAFIGKLMSTSPAAAPTAQAPAAGALRPTPAVPAS